MRVGRREAFDVVHGRVVTCWCWLNIAAQRAAACDSVLQANWPVLRREMLFCGSALIVRFEILARVWV